MPHGLSIDHHGKLWATDVATHAVMRLDAATGRVELTLGHFHGKSAQGGAGFDKPTDVAVCTETDEAYIADGYGNSRIAVYSYSGKFLREWGSAGKGEGQFAVPHSIVIDKRGLVYVADRHNARVQVFTRQGQFQTQWVSRVGADRKSAGGVLPSWGSKAFAAHVSSVAYSESLDLFAVVEGGSLVLRSPNGCEITQAQHNLNWPHDAVLLPMPVAMGGADPNRSALASGLPDDHMFTAFVAELDGKIVTRFDSSPHLANNGAQFGGYG